MTVHRGGALRAAVVVAVLMVIVAGGAPGARGYDEPTVVITLSYDRADEARLTVEFVNSRGGRLPFELADCQATGTAAFTWTLPASLFDTNGRYGAGPHEIRLSAIACGPDFESVQADPMIPYRLVVATYQAGAAQPESSREWSGAIDVLTLMGDQNVLGGEIPVIIPDDGGGGPAPGPEVEGAVYTGEIDGESVTGWINAEAGATGDVILAFVGDNWIEITLAESGEVGVAFSVEVSVQAASGCGSMDLWSGVGRPGQTIDGSDPAVVRADVVIDRENDCGAGLPSGEATVEFALPADGTSSGTIEVGGGTFPFSVAGPPFALPSEEEPQPEESAEESAGGEEAGGEDVSSEGPLPGPEEEGDAASPADEAEVPADQAPSGDPGVVPPGMDPGILGGPLVGNPGQVAQVLEDAEPDTGWSAMEILLAILVILGVATVAMAVKWVLGMVVAGERPPAKVSTQLRKTASKPPSEIADFVNKHRPLLDKALRRERRQLRESRRRRLYRAMVATEAPGSVAVSRPVDVTVGGRQVAVLQPGQPYTRIGYAPDGRTVVQWGPGADDIGVVPTEALETLPPPSPAP
jgi:hypothetical protein